MFLFNYEKKNKVSLFLLEKLYKTLTWIVLPSVYLGYRVIRSEANRKHVFFELLGLYLHLGKKDINKNVNKTIWVHSCSIGETKVALVLVREILKKNPDWHIVMTTTKYSGFEVIKSFVEDEHRVTHVFAPIDLSPCIKSFLRKFNPKLVLLVEGEIWPCWFLHCEKKGIQMFLVNAKLSNKSLKKYLKFGLFFKNIFSKLTAILAQEEFHAKNYEILLCRNSLNNNSDNVKKQTTEIKVLGNIKFDSPTPKKEKEAGKILRDKILTKKSPIWSACSLRQDEYIHILHAHKKLLETFSNALLIISHRHNWCDKIIEFAKEIKLKTQTFSTEISSVEKIQKSAQVLVVPIDMNKKIHLENISVDMSLPIFYAASEVAFVGGSLVNTGGQNPLEPISVGVPVIMGSSSYNFQELVATFISKSSLIQVKDFNELSDKIVYLFKNEFERENQGNKALEILQDNKGALEKTCLIIKEFAKENI